MNSMTAFSRLQVSIDTLVITWEIKSVNHRFLDQFYRLPEQFRHIEPLLRQEIAKVLQRGRIEINMQLKQQSNQLASFNKGLIADVMRLSEDIKLPNIWSSQELILSKQQTQLVINSFKEALFNLVTCRRQEGEVISKLLLDRVEKLDASVEEIKLLSKNSQQDLKEKLLQKIKVLYTGTFDEQRLEQELVIQLMRLDIAEELDRLDAHLNEIRRVLKEDKKNGRRLDFLVQECHRETNTIGSKTDSKKISQLAIDMKVLIEQMREQIQNVE